ncbi:hypothetical protein BH09SUM1_BH09SUM1_24690 [soil metagenome]
MKISRMAFLLAAMFALLLSAQGVQATSMIPVNLAQIVKYTETGFVGTCESVETVHIEQGWADKVTFKVTETIVGKAPADGTITWYQKRMGEASPIPGMPKYVKGAEHMIFLTAKASGSPFQAPFGLGQGAFKVTRNDAGAASATNEFDNKYLYNNLDSAKLRSESAAVATKNAAAAKQKGAPEPKSDGLNSIANQARALSASKDPVKDYTAAADTKGMTGGVLSAPAVLTSEK